MPAEPSLPARLLRDFVNTAEPQLGTDQLRPATVEACLGRLGLGPTGARLDLEELSLLIDVREGFRERFLDHAGHEVRPSVLQRLDDRLRDVPLSLSLGGTPALTALANRTAHHAVAAIVTAAVTVPPDEWVRLKACARESCRWAFFDSSRNRSGRWCSMAGCGNIVKMRRARRTRRGGDRAAGDASMVAGVGFEPT